jgi:NAD(P)-dependent dehydrogenase (short-subunit alcohol dehydrogenase family)
LSQDCERVVVVTGASGGVGRAAAREFAGRGCRVAVLARGEAGLEGAERDLQAMGARGLSLVVDVADPQAVEDAAHRIETELGEIDVWVNNAMATVFAPVWETDPDEFRRATDVTYLGAVWGTLAALRRMRARGRGSIVQVGSALAYRSIPLQSAYCGAKHALLGFTDSLRSELIHDRSGVRLTMVHLPGLNTPQFSWSRAKLPRHPQPVPPIYQPEIAARAIVWASEHDRREVWVGWPTYKTILGQRVAPGYLDRYLAENAWDAQMTDHDLEGGREGNLFEPRDRGEDFGARGIFGSRARSWSPLMWLSRYRGPAAAAAAAGGVTLSLWARSR